MTQDTHEHEAPSILDVRDMASELADMAARARGIDATLAEIS